MLVHGVQHDDLDIRVGNELPDTFRAPDVIVTQLPYQPGETRDLAAALNVVDDVALRLLPGGFAVILGPAAALTDEFPYSAAQDRAPGRNGAAACWRTSPPSRSPVR